MSTRIRTFNMSCIAILAFALAAAPLSRAQEKATNVDRGQARDMLHALKEAVEQHYYDPTLHGVDLNARYAEGGKKIDQMTLQNQAYGILAWFLDGLGDSHTFFLPPRFNYSVRNGWEKEMVGDKCYITAVEPHSDAEAQGIKRGDEVLAIEGYPPTRQSIARMGYAFNVLAPRKEMHLKVASPDGKAREVLVKAHVENHPQTAGVLVGGTDQAQRRHEFQDSMVSAEPRQVELGDALLIWKLPDINLNEIGVDEVVGRARKHKALILDLRDNGFGFPKSMEDMLGGIFENEVHVGDLMTRDGKKPYEVKGRGNGAYTGKLIVLVDDGTAALAELFARVVQLEKRGQVIGDHTSGEVRKSKRYYFTEGQSLHFTYGLQVTEADIVMKDGQSLERVGVEPDVLLLPTQADLAAGRDPVLAAAAQLAGVSLTPEKAGALFPTIWRTK
ncbi:MAG TPA: S41 family peptidase [Candidatus Acidoferrales bacterium]|nr:S41 family peptidase [Candidatus Acidoferrales bacterium]